MGEEEMFDVVDEADCVVGRASRGRVHREGLRHRAVHVFVFNDAGLVFLQKRSMRKDCFPGRWDSSASGHLDAGEDYDLCAERELREELGIRETPALDRLLKQTACAATGQEFVWLYRCRCNGPFVLQASEIETGDWFEREAVDAWIAEDEGVFAPGFVLLWRRYWSEAVGHSV